MKREKLLQKLQLKWLYSLFLFVCMFTVSRAQVGQFPELLVNEDNAPTPVACGGAETFTVTVRRGHNTCNSAQLKVLLPEGFQYQPNTIAVTGHGSASFQSLVDNTLTINLSVPGTNDAVADLKISFKAKALCSTIATAAMPVEQKPKMTYQLMLSNCGGVNQSGFGQVINVNYAALSVDVFPLVDVVAMHTPI